MAPKRRAGDPSRAVAYLRASTEDQNLGPEAQRASIEAWAQRAGVTVASWHEDHGVSGGAELDKRPALLAALDALRAEGAGVLIVAKRDRLARDVILAAMVGRLAEREGARVVSADGNGNGDGPEAELMRTILDAFAQYERAIIRGRVRAALAVKKSRGERIGSVPIGYRQNGSPVMELDMTEQTALERMLELRRDGASIREIARVLTAEGHKSRGARWHATTVARALRV